MNKLRTDVVKYLVDLGINEEKANEISLNCGDLEHVKNMENFYNKYFQFDAKVFVRCPELFYYDKDDIINKVNQFYITLGFDDKDLYYDFPELLMQNIKDISERARYYRNNYKFTKPLYKYCPELFIVPLKDIKYNEITLQNTFGMSSSQFEYVPYLLTKNIYELLETAKYLKREFGMKNKSFLNSPEVLILDIEDINDMYEFFEKHFDLSKEDLGKNSYLMYAEKEECLKVAKIFYDEIGFTNKEFKKSPFLLGLDSSKIVEDIDFYRLNLNYDNDTFVRNSKIFAHNINTVQRKLNIADECGIDRNKFKKNPILLGTPSHCIKFRYMLYKLIDLEEKYFDEIMIQNEKKTYSRYNFLKKNEKNICQKDLFITKQEFETKYNVKESELLKTYNLNAYRIRKIEELYKEKVNDKKINLDYSDIKFMTK